MNPRHSAIRAAAFLVAAIVFVSSAPARAAAKSASPLDADAVAVVERMSTFYQALGGFSVRSLFLLQTGPADSPAQKFEGTIDVQKPARIAASIKAGETTTSFHSDGKTLAIDEQPKNAYYETAAPASPDPILQRLAPGLADLLAADPKAKILEGVSALSVVGDDPVDGTACHRLRFTQKSGPVDVWIEAGAQPLLRRMVARVNDKFNTTIDIRFDRWNTAPAFDAKTFTFIPPPGATKIDPAARTPEKVEVAPIQFVPGASLESEVRKAHHAWCERVLIDPCKARMKGEPWNAEALAFLELAVDELLSVSEFDDPEPLAARGKKLIAAGCTDPLVTYLAARIAYRVDDDWRPAKAAFDRVLKQLGEGTNQPRALLCFIGKDLAVVSKRGTFDLPPIDRRVIAWTKEAITDGSYAKEDDVLFLRHQTDAQWYPIIERNRSAFAEVFAATELPEWVRKNLLGDLETKFAWDSRGSGWANSVTPQGWQGFEEHLKAARGMLEEVSTLRPDRPEAPKMMLTVVGGGGAGEDEEDRRWFDRAVAAQFDYLPAYRTLLYFWWPRWNGSHERMLAFGRACRDTQRYDTDVPLMLIEATDQISNELEDWRDLYRGESKIGPELIALDRAYLAEPSRKAQRTAWLSLLAVHAWLSGDYQAAVEPLAELHDQLAPLARHKLQRFRISPAEMLADLALRSGSGGAEVDRGDEFLEQKDLARARTSYEDATKLATERAAPLLRSRIAVTDFERALAGGGWVKITPEPGLLDWTIESGEWEVGSGGTLINRGTDARGVIFYRGRAGADVEFRGEFEIQSQRKRSQRIGIGLGYRRVAGSIDSSDNHWVTCGVGQSNAMPSYVTIYERLNSTDLPKKPFTLQPKNQFLARLQGRKVSFAVNGENFFEETEIPEGCTVTPDGQIGFATSNVVRGNTITIRNLEVRRIPH